AERSGACGPSRTIRIPPRGAGRTFLMCIRNLPPRLSTERAMRIGEPHMILPTRLFPSGNFAQRGRRHAAIRLAGFTMLELMIVMAILLILVGIAAVNYQRGVQRAREATLKSDLQAMRQAIEQYTLDKQAPPQSLDDLVGGQFHYLREVP